MYVRRAVLALLASAMAVTSVSGGAAAGTPNQPSTQQAQAGPGATTITLVTGDQVRLTKGTRGYSAVPVAGPGRKGVRFSTQQKGDSVWVYPSDTAAAIADGRLDRRLFEVSALAEAGYADGERNAIPLIVQHSQGKPVRALPKGAAAGRELSSVKATAVEQDKQTTAGFWKWLAAKPAGVERVWLDGPVHASLDQSVPQVGAPAAWAKGYTGKGVTVAVLDSGIDRSHLDLKGAVAASRNFSSSFDDLDHYGHGTHVASIITGDGARSGGKYKGVAPDATLLNGKVLGDDGVGFESDVIAGMEWAVAQQAKVVGNACLWKAALMGTTKLPVNESVFRQGAGFLDASRAVTQKVFALERGVSADVRWPYPQQVTRTSASTAARWTGPRRSTSR